MKNISVVMISCFSSVILNFCIIISRLYWRMNLKIIIISNIFAKKDRHDEISYICFANEIYRFPFMGIYKSLYWQNYTFSKLKYRLSILLYKCNIYVIICLMSRFFLLRKLVAKIKKNTKSSFILAELNRDSFSLSIIIMIKFHW